MLPRRSQRTQYGSGDGVLPLAVLVARPPVSTRYSTVTGDAEVALSVTGMSTPATLSEFVAADAGKPTVIAGDSSSVR